MLKSIILGYPINFMYYIISGTVTISPLGIASMCSRDRLEVTRNVMGSVLEWRINVTSSSRMCRRGIRSESQNVFQTLYLMPD